MLADERVLWMAQREALACSRIIACLQKIAFYRLATAQAFSLVGVINSIMSCWVANFCLLGIFTAILVLLADIPQHCTGGPHGQGQ